MIITEKFKRLIALWSPVLVIIAACIISAVIYFSQTEDYNNRLTVTGIVVNKELHRSSGGHRHSSSTFVRVYYSYSLDGITYEGYDDFGSADCEIGDSVEVFFKPDYPKTSSIIKHPTMLDLIAPFFLALPLSLGAWGLYSKRRY